MKKLCIIFAFALILNSCSNNQQSDFRTAVESKELYFGAAVDPNMLSDSRYKSVLEEYFNFVTAENVMKWGIIQPEQGVYNFDQADELVDFAIKNDMIIRGHTLVWHNQNPSWLEDGDFSRDELLEILEGHIKTVVTRYKGKIAIWDVVNEAIDGNEYRDTIWYRGIGPEYIEYAFKWAHEADPEAILAYNDYGIAQLGSKSDAVYSMVKELRSNNAPIDRVGFQLHVDMDGRFDFESMYMNMARFVDNGFSVDFTEIDIRFKGSNSDEKLEKQADYYKKLLEIMIDFDYCNAFTVWGVSDANSWIPGFFTGYDHALLFDKDYNAKPAVSLLLNTLTSEPVDLPYARDAAEMNAGRLVIPFFKANEANSIPVIDGNPNDTAWNSGVIYPFAFNQLSELENNMDESVSDTYGEWVILYSGNTIYGRVKRVDDIDVSNADLVHENDNIEVFFSLNGEWAQLRAVIGQDFAPHSYQGNQKAVWSSDNSYMEFMVELPLDDLAGQISGWNIALSDNDGAENGQVRDVQLYPINGLNNGWQGQGFGNIEYIGNSPKPPEEPWIIHPFQANSSTIEIAIDGNFDSAEWEGVSDYSLIFNQLNQQNMVPNIDQKDFYGSWGIKIKDNTIYGYVKRVDDITITGNSSLDDNDYIEFVMMIEDQLFTFTSEVNEDFITDYESYSSSWSSDGSLFEFKIELPEDYYGKFLPFNIAMADSDGNGAEYKQFSIIGENRSAEGKDLSDLQLNR